MIGFAIPSDTATSIAPAALQSVLAARKPGDRVQVRLACDGTAPP